MKMGGTNNGTDGAANEKKDILKEKGSKKEKKESLLYAAAMGDTSAVKKLLDTGKYLYSIFYLSHT